MIGNGIHVTNIFTGLGSISMLTGHWRRQRGGQIMTDKSMNVFSKYELISGAAAELHTVASRLRLKYF